MKRFVAIAFAGLFVAACGDDGGAAVDAGGPDAGPKCEDYGGAPCFELPPSEAMAYDSATMTLVAADWACAKDVPMPAAGPVTVSGVIEDFQTSDPVDGATIDAFTGLDFSTPLATDGPTPQDGTYTMTMATGAMSLMNFRTSKAGAALDTYALNVEVDIVNGETNFTRGSVSLLTANALPAFIGVTRTDGLGVLAGVARDCQGREVANVIATVSSTTSVGDVAPTFVPGALVFYFQGQDADPNLPTRRRVTMTENFKKTQDDGLFVIIEIPPTTGGATYFLQTWGFKTAADVAMGMAGLSLLSELEAPVVGDSVISVDMRATEGP